MGPNENNRMKVILIRRRSRKLKPKNEEEIESFEESGKSIVGRGNSMYGGPETAKCLVRSGN